MAMIIAIGAAKLRHWWHFPEFWVKSSASFRQALRAKGCLHAQVFPYKGHLCSFTAWESPAAMKAYATSGAHLKALAMGPKLTETSGFVTFPSDYIPSLSQAKELLDGPRRAFRADSGGKSPANCLIPRANLQE